MENPGDATLATYEKAAQRYRERNVASAPALVAFLDNLVNLVGSGTILELGSGPGRDASYLEGRGLQVSRTDGARAFVAMLRGDGHEARLLDIRRDEFGGPYDAVYSNAVLLHLSRSEVVAVLERARRAVVEGGVLAFTLKEGDGEGWSHAKLDLPRHFTYWRGPEVRAALESTGWVVLSVEHVSGRDDEWLFVMARAACEAADLP